MKYYYAVKIKGVRRLGEKIYSEEERDRIVARSGEDGMWGPNYCRWTPAPAPNKRLTVVSEPEGVSKQSQNTSKKNK